MISRKNSTSKQFVASQKFEKFEYPEKNHHHHHHHHYYHHSDGADVVAGALCTLPFLLGTSHPVGGIGTIPWAARNTADLQSYALFSGLTSAVTCGFQPPVSKVSDLFVLDVPLLADIIMFSGDFSTDLCKIG